MENKDKPTFPFTPNRPQDYESANGFSGLTKREYFAAMAMQGILSNPELVDIHGEPGIKWISEHSVLQADDLLSRLEK